MRTNQIIHVKALSIRQPRASMIAAGSRRWENRRRFANYRGPLLVHASRGAPEQCADVRALPAGRIIGVARLTACLAITDVRLTDCLREDAWGPWCYRLDNALQFTHPVLATGRQWLWNCEILPDSPIWIELQTWLWRWGTPVERPVTRVNQAGN